MGFVFLKILSIYLREREIKQEQGEGQGERERQAPLPTEQGSIPGPRDHLSRRLMLNRLSHQVPWMFPSKLLKYVWSNVWYVYV